MWMCLSVYFRIAQVVCLGILYGMGHQAAASKLNITPAEAQGLVRRYLGTYRQVRYAQNPHL